MASTRSLSVDDTLPEVRKKVDWFPAGSNWGTILNSNTYCGTGTQIRREGRFSIGSAASLTQDPSVMLVESRSTNLIDGTHVVGHEYLGTAESYIARMDHLKWCAGLSLPMFIYSSPV